MAQHPSDEVLFRWADGDPTLTRDISLEHHLDACQHCHARLALWTQESETLRTALALTPADVAVLTNARLPDLLVSTARQQRQAAGWRLLSLATLAVVIAGGWWSLEPLLQPAQGLTPGATSVALTMALGILSDWLWIVFTVPLPAAAALVSKVLPVAAIVLLLGLWYQRRRPAGSSAAGS